MGNLRIIGGQWRGRKLQFPVLEGVRPTGDRIRETLFNWLMHQLPGKTCLDLFAGSGALGLEALSRGAGHVIFVEQAQAVKEQLQANLELLGAENFDLYLGDALSLLPNIKELDLVFLDPPFQRDFLKKTIDALLSHACLNDGALLYLESEKSFTESFDLPCFTLLKEKTTGNVNYYLLRYEGPKGR